jgi:hypothetical protein
MEHPEYITVNQKKPRNVSLVVSQSEADYLNGTFASKSRAGEDWAFYMLGYFWKFAAHHPICMRPVKFVGAA